MREPIPAALLAVVSQVVASLETHATLNSLFLYAGAPGEPPAESKQAKALEWLRRINKDTSLDPLQVLGKLIESYMERLIDPANEWDEKYFEARGKISEALEACQLQYVRGGRISGLVASPSRSLESIIRNRDISSVNEEFDRALKNVNANPREAVSAACNILESVCKTYIEDEGLQMPAKQDLQNVWSVVRKHLGFDPSVVGDKDLQAILSGLLATVQGIGALRTHTSAAHGAGRRPYKLEPRHARLAIHSAHTIASFIIESWDRKRAPQV